MYMKYLLIAGVVGICLAAGNNYAFSEPGSGAAQQQRKGRGDFFRSLNVTVEQRKSLEENRKADGELMKVLRESIREKQKALQEAVNQPGSTKASVEPLIKDIKDLQAQLIDRRVDGIFAVKAILTPEQFAKFAEMMEKHRPGMRHKGMKGRGSQWMEEGGDRPMPPRPPDEL